jgi:hypothetical protein
MRFFLYEIVARIVAIYLCVYSGRTLWHGLVERKIRYFVGGDFFNWFLDWSNLVARRDVTPIQYWITMGIWMIGLLACLVVAIFGW